ncbi:MAG: hypothetical protein IT423_13530 [Pirellulaceae bacterium]|nr:hypothetical protein [Pirellulaceae bacterium]
MSLDDYFGFFDATQPYTVSFGELPHWEQEGATYFITFRTADSLPASVGELLTHQRDDWLRRHGIHPEREDWVTALGRLSHDLQRAYHREYATKLEAALDQGYGECVLRDQHLAKIVSDALLYFDGFHVAESPRDSDDELRSNSSTKDETTKEVLASPTVRYHVSDFVVMPNHAHVMVCFLPGVRLLGQCRSWKHYTAVKVNSALGRSGEFWQHESFDHLVRDPDHFIKFRNYIAKNREKAKLKPDEGIYYRCPDEICP